MWSSWLILLECVLWDDSWFLSWLVWPFVGSHSLCLIFIMYFSTAEQIVWRQLENHSLLFGISCLQHRQTNQTRENRSNDDAYQTAPHTLCDWCNCAASSEYNQFRQTKTAKIYKQRDWTWVVWWGGQLKGCRYGYKHRVLVNLQGFCNILKLSIIVLAPACERCDTVWFWTKTWITWEMMTAAYRWWCFQLPPALSPQPSLPLLLT